MVLRNQLKAITSKAQPLRRLRQLAFRSLHVPLRRVEVLVAEDLGQRHEIIPVVRKKPVGHRVPQQVRMNLEPADGGIFVAQCPDSTIRERTTFADKDRR